MALRAKGLRAALAGALLVLWCLPTGVAGAMPTLTPGATLWSTRDAGAGRAVAVSSDGSFVFAAGSDTGATTGIDYSTHAYAAATGAAAWSKRFTGPGTGTDVPTAVVVRGSNTVYVTGHSDGGPTTQLDFATVAYQASTGTRLWVRRYNGPGNRDDIAHAIAVTTDGSKVFVTGESDGGATGLDYATVAYDASTGARLWKTRYDGPVSEEDDAYSVAVDPGGSTVFVTGRSSGTIGLQYDYATVAYDATTGAQLWVRRYNGPGNGQDYGYAVAAAPDSTKIYVTGRSFGGSPSGTGPGDDYATIAYNASTGAAVWTKRFNGGANGDDGGRFVAVTSDGATVVVAGMIDRNLGVFPGTYAYGTIAYKSSDGTRLWTKLYGPNAASPPQYLGSLPTSLALSADGTKAYVTGFSYGGTLPMFGGTGYDYATVSYAVPSGTFRWASRYDAGVHQDDFANGVAVKPDGMAVYVTGESPGPLAGDGHFLTIAYQG